MQTFDKHLTFSQYFQITKTDFIGFTFFLGSAQLCGIWMANLPLWLQGLLSVMVAIFMRLTLISPYPQELQYLEKQQWRIKHMGQQTPATLTHYCDFAGIVSLRFEDKSGKGHNVILFKPNMNPQQCCHLLTCTTMG